MRQARKGGNRHPVAPREAQWLPELATFEVALYCDGTISQRGGGALVLGSPLNALRHLVELLAHDPDNAPLRAGEIISTGTLTLAMPVSAGQTWTTQASGIPLEDISVRFEQVRPKNVRRKVCHVQFAESSLNSKSRMSPR